MKKQSYAKMKPLRFKHFSRKNYSLFACLGKVVLIGVLSVSTLTYAKADSISVRTDLANDSLTVARKSLDEVIVTGSRAPLTSTETARMVTVITRKDIEGAAAESINDLLKLATGVDVRQRGAFGVQTDISINGGTFDQITILLNGMSLSSPQTGHNAADFPISLSDIERIEIIEGAAARLFGVLAFSGAINIVTKKDLLSNNYKSPITGHIEANGGSYGTFGGDAAVSFNRGKFNSSISTGYNQSDGGTVNSDFHKRRIYWQGGYVSKDIHLKWQTGISSQDFGASTFYSAKYDNQFESTRRYLASVAADIFIPRTRIVLEPSVYGHRDYDHYQLIHGKEGAQNGENYHRSDVYGLQLNTHAKWALGHTSIGIDLHRDHIISTAYGQNMEETDWHYIKGSARQYDKEGKRTSTSIFAEHNIVTGKVTLSAGLLANRNTGLDSKFRLYPGIDISFRPNNHWKLFASANKALRLPTFTDLYTNNAIQHGDINLKPEKNTTLKLGTNYQSSITSISANMFYCWGRDMIDWVFEKESDTQYHAMNIGEIDNRGFETNATLWTRNLWHNCFITDITVGYAFINQHHHTEQEIWKSLYALEYLRHKLTARINHRIIGNLSASWHFRWQQRMNGYHPYAKIDCKIQWTSPRFDVYVMADNLTAHHYYDIGGVLQPGLWIMAGAKMRI